MGGFFGGHADDALERWLLRIPAQRPGLGRAPRRPGVPRCGWCAPARRRCCTTTSGPGAPDAVGAYAAVGMRAAVSAAYIERAFYAYDDDAFLASLPVGLAAQARGALPPPPSPSSRDAYFDLVDELAAAAHAAMGDRARVMVSPVGLYWAADDFLTRCRDEAARRGIGVHMHLVGDALPACGGAADVRRLRRRAPGAVGSARPRRLLRPLRMGGRARHRAARGARLARVPLPRLQPAPAQRHGAPCPRC